MVEDVEEEAPIVEEVVSLGKSMGLEVSSGDVGESVRTTRLNSAQKNFRTF